MKKIDIYFLAIAALMLLGGVLLGITMAMSKNYLLTPVHAHANLVGWASMALFGLFYRAYPQLQATRVAALHFWIALVSAVVMPFAIYRAVVLQSEGLAIATSLGWLLAVLLFIAQVGQLARARD